MFAVASYALFAMLRANRATSAVCMPIKSACSRVDPLADLTMGRSLTAR
jgi:hypothetical protein